MTKPANPYQTTKLAYHPERIEAFRRGEYLAPVQIHLMPQNLCNQSCHFCAYRMADWKNSDEFDERQSIPWEILDRTLRDAKEMGVRAIEVTGGGEPTLYPWFEQMFLLLDELRFDTALVTNGTAVTAARAGLLQNLMWARVSIDSGTAEEYARIRSVPESHWEKAWRAVELLASSMRHPERRLGVGFVLTRENSNSIYSFCARARDSGADNVRLSVRFGSGGPDYYPQDVRLEAVEESRRAERELNSDSFYVANLIPERLVNHMSPAQDYSPCWTKNLLCVIGGDARVYTCCTLAFTQGGLVGSLYDKSFRELWFSDRVRRLLANFDPRVFCQTICLYEKRNLDAIEIVEGRKEARAPANGIHRNFI